MFRPEVLSLQIRQLASLLSTRENEKAPLTTPIPPSAAAAPTRSDVISVQDELNNSSDSEGRMKRPLDEEENPGSNMEDAPKRRRGEGPRIELRILLQSKNAGAIIGKGGANIKRLRTDFKASVTVPDSNGPERVLTISAELGTVLEALMDVIPCLEDQYKNKHGEYDCEIRMIVHQSQAGCIIGRAGFKVKELREKTGAGIKVYSTCCPNSTDRIVGITGKRKVVVGCVEEIIELLQSAPPKGPIQPYDPSFFDEFAAPEYGGYISSESRSSKGLPRGSVAPVPPGMRGGMRGGRMGGMDDFGMGMGGAFGGGMRGGRAGFGRGGIGNLRGGIGGGMGGSFGGMGDGGMGDGLGSRGGGFGRSGMRGNLGGGMGRGGSLLGGGSDHGSMQQNFSGDSTNISGGQGMSFGEDGTETTQVTIPKEMAGAIIGKGGARITEIRRRSGAQIVIDEALPGSNERIISITGTPEQIQNAQYMLQLSVKQQSDGGNY
ncbi:heterogeneous nuclear ribonucleoprotein K-like isoform X5 [Pomacea canaliculata]|uniref:heterogeneous nuclear ribonucleoprotein K-like isoform X5 n=1 Tax=Pomacea canaliculata TaxID=400727 RepID=UPI000D7280EF|nr:heterogeneous nuclear ribonucleoprotein K-like isoform X5 [Pomacea canaliculata]